jgi:hypothetical protein
VKRWSSARAGWWGHLAPSHAVDGIIDENDGNVLASAGSVNNLGHPDRSQVAVALIGEDNAVGVHPLDARGHSWGTAVGGFGEVKIQVVIGKHGTADRRHANGSFAHAQFVHHFGHQAVGHAMGASRAIVRNHIGQPDGAPIDELLVRSDLWFYSHIQAPLASNIPLPLIRG